MQNEPEAAAAAHVASQIRVIRGQRVLLDSGPAVL
jgi:hypothetical protein